MPKNPHAAPKLPLCEIADVFWTHGETEFIELPPVGCFLRRTSSGRSYNTVKSYSAPTPDALGSYRLSIVTVASSQHEKERLEFPGCVDIIGVEHTVQPNGLRVWTTHFRGYFPVDISPSVADAGRKGGKKTGRKGFAAMSKAEGVRVRALAVTARKTLKTITEIDRSPGTAGLARKARTAVRKAVER